GLGAHAADDCAGAAHGSAPAVQEAQERARPQAKGLGGQRHEWSSVRGENLRVDRALRTDEEKLRIGFAALNFFCNGESREDVSAGAAPCEDEGAARHGRAGADWQAETPAPLVSARSQAETPAPLFIDSRRACLRSMP